MKDGREAVMITSYNPKIPATATAQPVTETTPKYKNITIKSDGDQQQSGGGNRGAS
jgi:hypothetical protein